MSVKPTYEELEQRIRELETVESDLKHVNEKLLESETKYRNLFENMIEEVHLWKLIRDDKGEIKTWSLVDINPAGLKAWGKTRAETVGKTADEIFPDTNVTAHFMPIVQKIFTEGKPHIWESYFEGTNQYLHMSSVPLGEYYINTGVDITDRKRAEEAVTLSEENYRFQFLNMDSYNSLYEVVMDKDGRPYDFRFIMVNHAYEEYVGKKASELIGKTLLEVYPNTERYWIDKMAEAVLSGVPIHFENFSQVMNTYTEINLYIPKKGQLAMTTANITGRKKAEEALQQKNARLQSYFDLPLAGIAMTSPEKGWLEVSPGLCAMLGYSAEELMRMTWSEITHPEDLDIDVSHFNRVLSGAIDTYALTKRFIRKNRDIIWTRLSVACVRKSDNSVDYFIGLLQDITEHKNAEEALRQSEMDLKKSQKIAQLGSWRLDLSTNHVKWTEELYRMYGFDPSMPPPPYTEHMKLFTPESWQRLSKSLEETSKTGNPYELELETVREDGTHGWMWVYGQAEYDAPGNIVGLWGAAQDITDRKFTELALKESEERFRTLHNASFGGIAIHDRGEILECNKGLSEITGYHYNELIGMEWLQLIFEKTRATVKEKMLLGFEKPYEAIGIRKNGELYPIRLEARLIPYKRDKVWVCELRDMTEIKQTEKERNELEEKLRQAQKMEAVGRLAGGVAHDFNNMLSVIIGNTEIILEQVKTSDPLHDNLLEIQGAAHRSADITRQLLAFARKQTVSPKVLELNRTVEGMIKMLKRLIGEHIDLVWLPGDEVWPVKLDPSQIDQILVNLCINARDAIKDVGKITIETGNTCFDEIYCADHPECNPGDYVLLAVRDNGCGMDTLTLCNIFEPFFTTKETGKGTGLGLATVYGVVKQNGGYINVFSEQGKGTVFNIHFPRYREKRDLLLECVKDHPAERGSETILLVEDEPSILKMTKLMLEKMGYQVLAGRSPGEAIQIAQGYSGEINLLLADVVMPEMNGRDLAKNILSIYPNLGCIFMSGYTSDIIAHHGILDIGVNFIQKPFSRSQLGAMVRKVFDEAKSKI